MAGWMAGWMDGWMAGWHYTSKLQVALKPNRVFDEAIPKQAAPF
jgi:hypothetical protein